MVTIGDSFTVVAILAGICITAWALIITLALIFPAKAERARTRLVSKPWAAFFTGLAIWATIGVFSIILISVPLPASKLLGWMIFMGIASVASVGAAGLSSLASERLRQLAPEMAPFAALSKSAAFIVTAGMVPVLGWFLIVPFVVFASTGAGLQALLSRTSETYAEPGFMP